jgi:radical SAM superfamily enzyme YgiQ (UPF0313 family)
VWSRYSGPDTDQLRFIQNFSQHWVNSISDQRFDYILVSVFGHACCVFTDLFLAQLRPATSAVIVVGGSAVNSTSLVDSTRCYGLELKKAGLVDHYITGEGEHALIRLLQGQTGPGIDNTNPEQIDDLDSLPGPDYGFCNLDDYEYLHPGEKEIYITGSRGCVRRCGYCDVERFWPKYRYRSGKSIADEIISNYERFGITRFYFTDSLVNGSLKAFSEQCDHLARYQFDQPIHWGGQFIYRSIRATPADHYEMIRAAGGDFFYVGFETGSDRLRFEMGKKFTNDDIDWNLEQMSCNRITVMPLMFTGYVTETLEDHHDTLKIFDRWQRYVSDGTITAIELGSDLIILPGAPVERMIESHDIRFVVDDRGEANFKLWHSMKNADLDLRERIRRKVELHETAIAHHWPVWRQQSRLNDLKQLILNNQLHIKTPTFTKIIDIKNGSW